MFWDRFYSARRSSANSRTSWRWRKEGAQSRTFVVNWRPNASFKQHAPNTEIVELFKGYRSVLKELKITPKLKAQFPLKVLPLSRLLCPVRRIPSLSTGNNRSDMQMSTAARNSLIWFIFFYFQKWNWFISDELNILESWKLNFVEKMFYDTTKLFDTRNKIGSIKVWIFEQFN